MSTKELTAELLRDLDEQKDCVMMRVGGSCKIVYLPPALQGWISGLKRDALVREFVEDLEWEQRGF